LFGVQAGESVLGQGRGAAATGEAFRNGVARLAEEHGEVAGRGAGRQRVLEGAFELPVMRVTEDVIDERASARPLDRDGDVQADQFERVTAAAEMDARKRRLSAVASPDLRLLGLLAGRELPLLLGGAGEARPGFLQFLTRDSARRPPRALLENLKAPPGLEPSGDYLLAL